MDASYRTIFIIQIYFLPARIPAGQLSSLRIVCFAGDHWSLNGRHLRLEPRSPSQCRARTVIRQTTHAQTDPRAFVYLLRATHGEHCNAPKRRDFISSNVREYVHISCCKTAITMPHRAFDWVNNYTRVRVIFRLSPKQLLLLKRARRGSKRKKLKTSKIITT